MRANRVWLLGGLKIGDLDDLLILDQSSMDVRLQASFMLAALSEN